MLSQRSEKGDSALNFSFSLSESRGVEIVSIRLHLSDFGGGGELKIWLDSSLGSEFDTVHDYEDMKYVKDYLFTSLDGEPIIISGGDALVIEWPNPNNVTYGIEILYR